jgi:hypothetical protein
MSLEIRPGDGERDEPSIVLSQLARLDGAIEKEFTLIGDRMTWMVVSPVALPSTGFRHFVGDLPGHRAREPPGDGDRCWSDRQCADRRRWNPKEMTISRSRGPIGLNRRSGFLQTFRMPIRWDASD